MADAPQISRATKGAALGMKMGAYLYQKKCPEVLTVVEQVDEVCKIFCSQVIRVCFCGRMKIIRILTKQLEVGPEIYPM